MSLKRNTLYNFAGALIPMFIGMVTVPIYLHKIGDARYGVLAIVWLFLGYFGLFDPGITRAATYHIARLHSDDQKRDRESVFWTALLLNVGFGIVGGLIVYFAGRPIFMTYFNMPESLRTEVMASLPWLAASVPVSIGMGVLGGALQARERFGLFNSISVGSAMVTQLLPLAVAVWWSPDLRILIPAALLSRTAASIPMAIALIRALPLGAGGGFHRSHFKPLFSYGGWITLTNFLNPVLTSMDRMLIGGVLNAQSVAFYSVPFNLVTRASIIPGSLSTSLFPRLSKVSDEERARLAGDSVIALAAVMTPVMVIGIACMPIFMRYWVGADFARNAAGVGVVLLIGMWANGLSFIPYEHLQATGRPDLVAKFHAFEVVPFLGVLWIGLHSFGLMGAAWAWTARVIVDALLLFLVAGKIEGWHKILPGGLLVLIASGFAPTSILSIRTVIELALIAGSFVWSWRSSPLFRRMAREMILNRLLRRNSAKTIATESIAPAAPPSVSIAMATYKGGKFLRAQLDSLAAQTLLPCELVVTDDGSPDDTLAVLEEFAATAPFPVRVFPNAVRLGYGDNFLRAASLCTGDLISFCDQDDVWLPHKLAVCVQTFSDPDVILCAHSAEVTGEGVAPGLLVPGFDATVTYDPLGYYPLMGCHGFAMVFRRTLLSIADNQIRPAQEGKNGIPMAHDQWVWFLGTIFGKTQVLSEVLVHYRQHGNNTCGTDTVADAPLQNVLTAGDYRRRSVQERKAAVYLENLSLVCADAWRSHAVAGAAFFSRCSAVNSLRTQFYNGDLSLFGRSKLYLSLLLRGGYSAGQVAAWLGLRTALKDLGVGVLRLHTLRSRTAVGTP